MGSNELPHDIDQETDELPTFDLTYLPNDDMPPTEITVFPGSGGNITSTWITIDIDHAVPLEEIA